MSATESYLKRSVEVFVRLGLVVALVIWCFQILRPFLAIIIWGMVIAVAVMPQFRWLRGKTGWSHGRAAVALVLLLLALLIFPAVEFSRAVVGNATGLASRIDNRSLQVPPAPERIRQWPVVGEQVYEGWDMFSNNLGGALMEYKDEIRRASRWLLRMAAGAGIVVFEFMLSIVVAGVFLAYAESSGEFARKLGRRLAGDSGEEYAQLMSATVRSVAQGVLGVAFLQSLLAGLGFLAADIPAAGLLTLLVMVLSIIQLGAGLVIVPTVAYMFSVAELAPALAYTAWAVPIMFIDNILKPILLGRGAPVPMWVIFVGAIGGFITNGFVGLFIGAVILAMGYELFTTWLNMEAA